MNYRPYVLVFLTALLSSGCGASSGPDTAMISGVVYLDGAPAAAVDVNFMNGEHSAFGRTDADGRFKLVSGAAVGDNTVYFSKIAGGTGYELNPDEGMDEGQLMAMRDPALRAATTPKQLIPAPYSDPAQTTISFVVPDGGAEDVEFKLTSK